MTNFRQKRDPHNRRPDDLHADEHYQTGKLKLEWTAWSILLSIIVLIVGAIVASFF